MSKSKKLEEFIEEATANIKHDRDTASTLLMQLMVEMGKDQSKHIHADLGEIAAKYLETMQRSNEQLVKIAAIVQKREGSGSEGLSKDEKDEIFDAIKGE